MIDYGNRTYDQRLILDDEISDEIGKLLRSASRVKDVGFVWAITDAVEELARLKKTIYTDPKKIAAAAFDRAIERERRYSHETGAVRGR